MAGPAPENCDTSFDNDTDDNDDGAVDTCLMADTLDLNTVSIGGAVFEPGMAESAMLIEAADEKLYEAKRTGRNKVVI